MVIARGNIKKGPAAGAKSGVGKPKRARRTLSPTAGKPQGFGKRSEGPGRPKSAFGKTATGPGRPKPAFGKQAEGPGRPKSAFGKQAEGPGRPKPAFGKPAAGPDRPKTGPRQTTASGKPVRTSRELRSARPGFDRRLTSGKTSHEQPKTGHENELIRLNKYLAGSGIGSRREADELIKAGLVTVNGKLVTEMGTKISAGDVVKYNGEVLREEKKVYVLLNKPKDYVTTVEDPHAKKTVLELIKGACRERIYPVGRLDRNTTGVLLFTNDGELTRRLTHPRFEKLKIYHVHLNKNLKGSDLDKVATGINLDDGFIKADAINYADADDKSQVGIEIHSGRNHIVRRIFESLGYEVVKLDRVYFAGLTKKNLQRGEWRHLTEKEVIMLRMNAFK